MEEIPMTQDNTKRSSVTMETHPRSGGLKRSRHEQMGHGGKERRTRTIFNMAQINALERIFMDVEYPDGDLKAKLAHRLEVDENTIQIWFQNRRAKKKRLQRGQPMTNTGEQFHQHQTVSHSGHLLPISDRRNYLPVTAEGVVHFPSIPRESQCYSTSSMMMGHPDAAMHWAGKTHFSNLGHYGMDPNRIQSLPTQSSPIALVKEKSSLTEASSDISPSPSPAQSVQSPSTPEGGVIDQIKNWPVKEPPTSQSVFGKLDFPKLPRVCIRHDSAQMRNVPNGVLGASSPVSKGSHRDIAKLRMNVLKKDPPKSPPPNQTCAAIPRSQRNELELALMKHGLIEDAASENGPQGFDSGHRSGYISDDWSSSSEESSDSEGLAPPRRRRKVLRDRKKPPPNTNCVSVPLQDRTLPYLSKIPQYSSEKVPTAQSAATPPLANGSEPRKSLELSIGTDNLSDWDTESDDSSWAYFDQGPRKETAETKDSPQALLDLPIGHSGPQSAPPALEPVDSADANLTTAKDNECAGVADCADDEFSEIILAREFAEMLPSPLGTFLPVYHEEQSPSNQGREPYRRSRIHSDSALITSRNESLPQPQAHIAIRNSPVSTKSSDSSLSGLSSLFSIPVSPSELVKHLSDDVDGINQSTTYEVPSSSRIPEQSRQLPAGLISDVGQHGIPQSCQPPFQENNNRISYGQQHQNGATFMNDQKDCRESHCFHAPDSQVVVDRGHMQKSSVRSNTSGQGIIRPIPTRPPQVTSSPPDQSNMNAPNHVSNTVVFPDSSAIPCPIRHQRGNYGQHPMQGDPNLPYSDPSFQETGPTSVPHSRVDAHPHTVIHHQPPPMFASHHPPRWPSNAYGADLPGHPTSAPPKNVQESLPMAPSYQAAVGVSSTSDDNLPPNQVCTAVPDAVSSQGLMARYLAWTQGRILER